MPIIMPFLKKAEPKKEIITEANSDMKLLHLYGDPDISLQDIQNILQVIRQGDFVGVEKADGYNLRITWRNGELYVARNKTEISEGGLNLDGLYNKNFQGGRKVKEVFLEAYEVIENIFFDIPQNELNKIFLNDQNFWINCEIVSQNNNNFIKYDSNWVLFHRIGSSFYEPGTSKKMVGIDINPFFEYFLEFLPKKKNLGWSFGEDPEFRFNNTPDFRVINRYLNTIEDFYYEYAKPAETSFKKLAESINPSNTWQDVLQPVLTAVYNITVELLNGASSSLNQNSFSSSHASKDLLLKAVKACKNYKGQNEEYVRKIYEKNIGKIDTNAFSTSLEGIIFKWGSKFYKITGMFAPANQIVGLYTMGAKDLEPLSNTEKSSSGWGDLEESEMTLGTTERRSNTKVTYLYPGSFKPPHMGHFDVLQAIKNDSNKYESSQIVIFVSSKSKFTDSSGLEITADDSQQIWEMFVRDMENVDIRISQFDTPIKDVYEFIKSEAQQGEQVFVSVSSKDERSDRFKKLPQFGQGYNVTVTPKVFGEVEGISSTLLRKAIDSHSPSAIFEYMPGIFTKEDKQEIWNIIFKKKDNKVDVGRHDEEYDVLNEENDNFSDVNSVVDKSDILTILPFQNIFGEKTRIVTPLILTDRSSVNMEELTKLVDDSNWMLDPYLKNVTKTIDDKQQKMSLIDYLDKFMLVVSKLLMAKSLKSGARTRVMQTLLHLTDYDETQLLKKYGNLVDLLSTLRKIRDEVEEFSENSSDLSIIISRHPSDIEKLFNLDLKSNDFYENLINLKDQYIVSYIVSNKSLPKDLEGEKFQFSTSVSEMRPISKLKINKIYSRAGKYEFAVPETSIFGKYKEEHLENVTNFLKNAQNIDVFDKEEGAFFDLSEFYVYDRRDINLDLDRYFGTTFFTKSRKKPRYLKTDSSRLEEISREAQQWLSDFYKTFEDTENLKNIRLASSFLPFDDDIRNFNVDFFAEIKINISEFEVQPNVKSWIMSKIDELDDSIEVVRTKSYIDLIDDVLEMEINCRYMENDLDGFEQAEYFKRFVSKLDEFMSSAFKVQRREAPKDIDIKSNDYAIEIDYKKRLSFMKLVTPKDWEPVIDKKIIIKDDHFGLGIKYVTEVYGIDSKELPVDIFYFNEHLSEFSENEFECSYFVKFICRPNDSQKLIKKINTGNFYKLSEILEAKFKDQQNKVINSVLEYLINDENKNDDEYNMSEEIYENLVSFYDIRSKSKLL